MKKIWSKPQKEEAQKEVTELTGRKYWLHRYLKLTLSALALFGCIVAIILAELTARVLFPAWVPITEEDVKFWTYELLG